MNKKIQHIRALVATTAAIALLMLAPTACVNTIAEYEDPEVNNPEAELDPSTPIAVSAILSAYGTASPSRNAAEPARAASTLADIGAIPAQGEITAETTLSASEGAASGNIHLFGANTGFNYSAHGAVSSFVLKNAKNGDSPITLHMSDFNIKPAGNNGTQQAHSRLGMADFQNSSDRLIGFADRTLAADKSIAYQFAMRHATAKVSVLVVDITGTPIDMSTDLDTDLSKAPKLTAYNSTACIFETESGKRKELSAYMKTTDADGDYPSTTATNAALATIPAGITKDYQLGYPTTNTVTPKNLINVIVTTNPTAKADDNGKQFPAIDPDEEVTLNDVAVSAIATGLSGVNDPVAVLPFDATAGKANPHRITLSLKADEENGSPAGTYGINLNDIVLTGLPEGDGRLATSTAEPTEGDGRLRYLLPGEHVVVTLKIDRNKLISATATIAPWIEASASGNVGDNGNDSELVKPFDDINFCTALAAMSFDADGNSSTGGTLKLTFTADGYIDMSSEKNRELISNIKSLNVSKKKIKSLKGIECFTSLTELNCYNNELTALDLSANTELTKLYCYNNSLTALDVTKNTELTTLYCYSNPLTAALDVTQNTKLTDLNCYSNQLATLDVTQNTKLTTLNCYSNQLATLDVSNNTELTTLNCSSNLLTAALDVSKNTKLTHLNCYSNQLATLNVTKNTKLTDLNCYSNQLATLDVSNNTELTTLNCYSNLLTAALNVTANTNLLYLYCYNNQLAALDVTKNTKLTYLYCYSNQLTALDVTNNTYLNKLYCYSNRLAALDASKMVLRGSTPYEVYCGNQTTDGSTVQELALKLGQKHKLYWESILNDESNNKNVIVSYIN